jgi:hypothetical protein
MQCDWAKKVAGTLVEDQARAVLEQNAVLAWVQKECRSGSLRQVVDKFAEGQAEILDPALVLVETVKVDQIECCIPCRVADHESRSTFLQEVRFTLNPVTGQTTRLLV